MWGADRIGDGQPGSVRQAGRQVASAMRVTHNPSESFASTASVIASRNLYSRACANEGSWCV